MLIIVWEQILHYVPVRNCAHLVLGETPGAPIWKTDNMTNGNCRMVILSQSLKIVLQPKE